MKTYGNTVYIIMEVVPFAGKLTGNGFRFVVQHCTILLPNMQRID